MARARRRLSRLVDAFVLGCRFPDRVDERATSSAPIAEWDREVSGSEASLLAKTKAGPEQGEDKLAQDTARFAMQLQRHVGPHLGWLILVEIGFLGWVGATVGLIWYVVDEQGNFARRQGCR